MGAEAGSLLPARPRIAYFTDYPDRETLIRTAFGPPYRLKPCSSSSGLIHAVGTGTFDLVLLDLVRPDGQRQDWLLDRLSAIAPSVPQHVFVRLGEREAIRHHKDATYQQVYLTDTVKPGTLLNSAESRLMADPVRSALSPAMDRLPNPLARQFGEYCLHAALDNPGVEEICDALDTSSTSVADAFYPVGLKPYWVVRACREASIAYATERGRGSPTHRAKAFQCSSLRAMYESFKRFAGWPLAQQAAYGGLTALLQMVLARFPKA